MSLSRVALIYDDRPRPETTGTYCRRALDDVVHVEHMLPDHLASRPGGNIDLFVAIDDGLDYAIPPSCRPLAYWAIDTHLDFDRALCRARVADFAFSAQRDGAEQLRNAGVPSAMWLPLACDPAIHRQHDVPKQFDVCFVGNLFRGARSELVRLLQHNFRHTFVGQAYFDEMSQLFSASRTVFNRSVRNDMNMCVFEALACGSLLITNDLSENGQADWFRDGVHLATYRDADELIDKVRYYLARESLRERIAAAGKAEVVARHTYAHRMRELLATVEGKGRRGSISVPPPSAEPEQKKAGPRTAGTNGCGMGYFDFARPELAALVPAAAKRVLDVGCGAGRLGEALKACQSRHVVGIELDPDAAAEAARRLDRVIVGNAEHADVVGEAFFDCIICGDVLEHMVDAEGFLRRARDWLSPDGVLVASIPNVRHHSVVNSLLAGNWTYEPAGLLDQTHLRFFARRDIEFLFRRSGFRIKDLESVPGPGHDDWIKLARPSTVRLADLTIEGLPADEAQEFFVYQYLVTAIPAVQVTAEVSSPTLPHRMNGDTSAVDVPKRIATVQRRDISQDTGLPKCVLLMVTYNRLDYTRLALEAVLAADYPQLDIVVWDNGSTDGTVDYLRERLDGVGRARLVAESRNWGIVHPMNEVWGAAQDASVLAKVDNDTLIPADMLRRLAACHCHSRRFGVLSGFHFRREGEALATSDRLRSIEGVTILPQMYVGGCSVMLRRSAYEEAGPIPCRAAAGDRPFMDSGWTVYQQQLAARGLVNGYPWPLIHVDHMEDVRSPHCIRTAEHETYKRDLRGMSLAEFTEELCVWRRPHDVPAAAVADPIGALSSQSSE